MSQSAIIMKLESLLAQGISSEADAAYFLVEIRKLLEHQEAKRQYKYLTFHCDWALHSTLQGTTAQEILEHFDSAHLRLKDGIALRDLPDWLRREMENISKMRHFERELKEFLQFNGIPALEDAREEGWIHFVHLFAKIVEDCPLVMKQENEAATIRSVTLKVDFAKASEIDGGDMFFKFAGLSRTIMASPARFM